MNRLAQLGLALAFAAPAALAQQAAPAAPATPTAVAPPAAPAAAGMPAAKSADVASIDAIIAAVYDVISGPAGAPRDWDRMRSLFAPEGRMGVVGMRPDGSFALRTLTPEDYDRYKLPTS